MAKITSWGSRINDIPLDRIYKVKNAIVNEYNDTKLLIINGKTIFSESDHNIHSLKVALTDLVICRLRFAPEAITDMHVIFT